MWVPKLGAAPWALMWAWPAIGPPVLPAILAISASDSGSNSPALLPAGTAQPFSHLTASSGISQMLGGARAGLLDHHLGRLLDRDAVEKVAREPPVRKV